jgi:drug/metabolite transporter (DMT)-like permease
MFGESHAIKVWLSLVPVVAGVMLASAKEIDPGQIASYGIPITMIGALLAALKTILTGRLQKQLHMSSPDLLSVSAALHGYRHSVSLSSLAKSQSCQS